MARITVEKAGEGSFRVTVVGRRTTSHAVTVRPGASERLAGGPVPDEELVRESFEFLLEREDNTDILPRFDLEVIARYFPEYTREIGGRLGGREQR